MSKGVERPATDRSSVRTVWIILIGIFTLLLLIDLFRWAQGSGKWDAILVPSVFLLIGATHVFRIRGMPQKVMIGLSAILAVLSLVMLIMGW